MPPAITDSQAGDSPRPQPSCGAVGNQKCKMAARAVRGWVGSCPRLVELVGILINVYKYLKRGRQRDLANLFSVVCRDRTRGNGHKMEPRKFCTNMQKDFFTVRVTEHWKRLPREVVESPSLEISKARLDTYLGNLL